jgi:hypothetical protein
METAKEIAVPDTVPDTVPFATTPVLLSDIESGPEKALPDCEIVHDIRPGPDESVAVPDHVPAMLVAGVVGVVGVVGAPGAEPPPLPQPLAAIPAAAAATAITAEIRVRIMRTGRGF